MKAYEKRLRKRAAKVEHLREAGAHSAVGKMAGGWMRRGGTNVRGFWNDKEARK